MGAIATFDPVAWAVRYPEFAAVPSETAQAYFGEACLYWRNDGSGPVNDPAAQLALLNMMTAHLAALYSGADGDKPQDVVGRINSATQGPVSISTDIGQQPGSAAWFQQTKYGFGFWQATAAYRTRPRYYPGFRRY